MGLFIEKSFLDSNPTVIASTETHHIESGVRLNVLKPPFLISSSQAFCSPYSSGPLHLDI